MNLNYNQYNYIPHPQYNNFESTFSRRTQYSKGVNNYNINRSKSNSIMRAGNPKKNNNNFNKYYINDLNQKKQKEKNFKYNDDKSNLFYGNNYYENQKIYNGNKKDNYIPYDYKSNIIDHSEFDYDKKNKYYFQNRKIYDSKNHEKFYFNNNNNSNYLDKYLNSKTEINKRVDHYTFSQKEDKYNDKNITDYLTRTKINNKDKQMIVDYNQAKTVIEKNDEKNNKNKEPKNQDINYKYNEQNNFNKNKNLGNDYDKIINDINNNKNINKEKENPLYYEEKIDKETTLHHKSSSKQSKSVNPYQNSITSESYKITNSLTGLNNLGATCYMNSALQNIIHCKKFIDKLIYYRNSNIIKDNKNNNQNLSNSFINLCYSLIQDKFTKEKNYLYQTYSLYSFSPTSFKKEFCSKHTDYIRGQHDSIEFLRNLLDDISKEININKNISAYKELITEGKTKEEQNKEYHNFFISRENSIIIEIFYIQMINIFKCKCGFESYSFQKLLDIPLLLPMKKREVDLLSLIKEYLSEETIDWSSECENCKNKNVKHYKKIRFSMINDILIFSLQRFDPFLSMKSSINVSFKEEIDLKDFCDPDLYKMNTKFKLCGTINHIGNINYGHYYSYIKIGELWYEFNDSIVNKIKMEFNSSSVCVLFYEKKD